MNYVTILDVNEYAKDNGRLEWLDLTKDQKNRAINESTQDINMYHGQFVDGSLWQLTDTSMLEAATIQSIYVGLNQGNRDLSESISTLTDNSYSDDILEIDNTASKKINTYAKHLIDYVIKNASDYTSNPVRLYRNGNGTYKEKSRFF